MGIVLLRARLYAFPVRIAYVTHTRFPTEKAHGTQIAHVCAALSSLGHHVELVVPDLFTNIRIDPFRFYALKERFPIVKLPVFDALHSWFIPGKFAFTFTMRSYKKKLRQHLAVATYDLLYARSPAIARPLLASGLPVVLELHTLPRRGKKKFAKLCNQCKKIVCLTEPMKHELIDWGVHPKVLVVEGDAVDVSRFSKLPTLKKAKHHWDLPEDRPVIGYVGSLVTFDKLKKGVDVLLDALVLLHKQDVPFFGWVVGGPTKWKEWYHKQAITKGLRSKDIRFDDHVLASSVPEVIQGCDICVYPAPRSKHHYFRRDTSPLKLFEYLAAGKIIVCADIPPLKGVVTKETVKFFHPGSASSLASALREVMDRKAEAKKRAANGVKLAQNHTWEKRMGRILDSLKTKTKAR